MSLYKLCHFRSGLSATVIKEYCIVLYRQTLLPVREINLKACTPVILKQFILPGLGIEPRPG